MMKLLFTLILCGSLNLAFSQTIPTAPNQRNAEGRRIGDWVITYSKSWKETALPDSIAYYRRITFDVAGKPIGKTQDFYRSGALQFEGMMLQIEPKEIADGVCIWYYENGNKSKEVSFKDGKEEGIVKIWFANGKPQYQYSVRSGNIEGIAQSWDEKGDSTVLYFEKGKRLDRKELAQQVIALYEQGKYLDAISIAKKCKEIALLTLGETHSDYAMSLNNLATLYESQGQYAKAEPLFAEALAIRKKSLGETHPDYAMSLNNLATLYVHQSQYAKAEPLFAEALAIRKKSLGETHPDYAMSLNNLAGLYKSQGQYAKAEPLFAEALAIRKKSLGETHPDYAASLNNLAALYKSQDQYNKAEPYYEQALAIRKKSLGETHPNYAESLSNLAGLYESQDQYNKAEPLYVQALAIRKKSLGETHPNYANSLNNLASLYVHQGQYAKAEPLFAEALAIYKKSLGESHPNYAMSLNNLAYFYYDQGQYAKAEPLHAEALAIYKKTLGETHPDYAMSLNNLAYFYYNQGQYAKAEPLFAKALAIRKKSLGETHSDYAMSLNNLATLYVHQSQYAKAEPLFAEALAIYKKSLGESHSEYAMTLNNLASFYESQGQYVKAELFYVQAFAIQKKVLGEQHPDYANTLNNLAVLYGRQGQYTKVASYYKQAYTIKKENLLSFFNMASDQQQEAFYNKENHNFLLGYSLVRLLSGLQNWAYDNALFTKGLRLASGSGLQAYLNQSTDTALVNGYQQYLAVKRTLGVQYSKPIKERFGVAELENQAELLEKELMRKSAAFRDFKKAFQITFKEVQKALKPHQVAIEFIDYPYHNGKKWTDTTYYAALVLRPGWTSPKMVVLCEKKQLEAAIAGHGNPSREAAAQALYSFNRGVPVADSKSQVYEQNLYQLLWKPMKSLLAGAKTIYYSPASLLHRLNLEAIAVSPTQRLGEVYEMSRLSSTRQLAQAPAASTGSAGSLLVGGVNYDADSVALAQVNQLYQTSKSELTASRSAVDSRGKAWVALANTGPEVKAIAAMSKTIKADTLLGNRATEEAFSHYLQFKPRIVHLATHGFFYEPPKDTATRKKDEPAFVNATDALMRSGLVLAGANGVWQGKAPLANQEDGILTAYEISLKDFRNTDLVVLSACETGLGDIKGSEGVFGLQRAFKIAGAKNIIMSLWKVPDKATRELMEAFYGYYLKEGKSIRESFKLAVNRIRQQYSEPYYWAAFVLTE